MDIEVREYTGEGYKPVIDYETWRVAILNYIDELEVPNIEKMQKHLLSDEVFVLLKGNFTLFTAGNGDEIGKIQATKLEPYKMYNVKAGVWHTHTLDEETSVLIVENQNTCDDNSPELFLTQAQRAELAECFQNQ
ncbi:MAG: hypothetical protein IJ833_09565 [Lachnospiraceae bacterium]|nr:hypothetical protein [Lachnospiraceae bacterium]